MKHAYLLSWTLLLVLIGPLALAQDSPAPSEPEMMPGMLIVKFSDPSQALANQFADAQQKQTQAFSGSDALVNVLQNPGVYCFARALKGNSTLAQQIFCLRFDPDQVGTEALRTQLDALPSVEYVEENAILQGQQEAPGQTTTNDPRLGGQYNVQITRALEARALVTGGGTATVAVVDDAVLTAHEDLADNIYVNEGETGLDSAGQAKETNGVDDDGNGYVDDVQGYDIADDDNDPTPPPMIPFREGSTTEPAFYHGTHVAGCAAAVTNNSLGVASVSANRVKIIPIKATPDSVVSLTYTALNVAGGITYAIDAGADVVNLSLGSPLAFSFRLVRDIIEMSAEEGVLLVASAGNRPFSDRGFPAAFDEVMAVAGTATEDIAYANTSFGDWIDVAAPAVDILSTYVAAGDASVTNVYREATGTSFACPLVAGLAGLLKAQDPSLTPEQLRQIIRETADPVDAVNPRLAGQLGAGRVNVYNAVASVRGEAAPPVADVVTSATTVYTTQAVKMIDRSLGNGLSYAWEFAGGTPASSTEASPTVRYERPGRYSVRLRVTNTAGTDEVVKEDLVIVQPVGRVDVVGFPFEGEISARTFGGSSRFLANRLVYPEDRLLTSVKASFFEVSPLISDQDFLLKVWRIKNGLPEQVHEQAVDLDKIEVSGVADVPVFNDIMLTQAVNITAADTFLVGFELLFGDLSIHRYASSDRNGLVDLFDAAAAEGELAPFTWLIFPTLVASDLLPEAPPLTERVCANEPLTLDASGRNDAFDYRWRVEKLNRTPLDNGPVIDQEGALATVVLPESTDYRATLQLDAKEDFEVERLDTTFRASVMAALSDTLTAVDCDQSARAFFEASSTTVAVSEQVTYRVQANTNATDFAWQFPGGEPATSDQPEVTVTYPTSGVYGVTLATRNSGGNVDTLRVDDYVVVTDETCADVTVAGLPLSSIDQVSSEVQGFSSQGFDSLRAFGNLFELDPAQSIYGARLQVISSFRFRQPDATVTFFVWDDDGQEGTPGTVLAQQQYTYREIDDLLDDGRSESSELLGIAVPEERTIDLTFDRPVPIPADSTFILGYEITYEEGQVFGVYYNYAGESPEEDAFARFANGNWASYEDATGGFLEIRLALGALVGAPPSSELPTAALTVSPGPYAPGEPIQLSVADTSGNAVAYRWEATVREVANGENISEGSAIFLSDDRLITQSGENRITLLPKVLDPFGLTDTLTYTITLVALNECGLEDRVSESFSFVKGDDPDAPPTPTISLSLINANTGEVLFDFSDREEDPNNLIYLEDPQYQGVPLSFRADLAGDSVGSIAFSINGSQGTEVRGAFDDAAPYELVGGESGQIDEWVPSGADYFVNAVAFSLPGAEGIRGTNGRVRLLVYDSAMIPLEVLPRCSDDSSKVRWEIENFNNTDITFEYQYEGLEEDEWRFGGSADLAVSSRSDIITTPADSSAFLRIRWRNELGEFEFAEASPSSENCPTEESARWAVGKTTETQVYPNPTSGELTLTGWDTSVPPTRVTVSDVLGRVRFRSFRTGGGKVSLDLSALPPGWYHVRLESSEASTLHRVLKQ